MKWKPFHFSLSASLLFHAALLAVGLWVGASLRPPELRRGESLVTLTLVAAPPDADADAPSAQPAVEKVAPIPVAPPVPVEAETAELVLPAEPVEPVSALATPSPPAQQTTTHGDGSSPIPGLDATTQTATPGVKARPDYLKNPEPPYPLLARRRRQEGLVLLAVKVSVQGHAREVLLKQSSGYPLLDESALDAVRRWEFEPARVGSLAVEYEIEVPVRFQLQD